MQRIIEAVQAALYRYGGALNKFLADDKGTTLIAAFNLPMPAFQPARVDRRPTDTITSPPDRASLHRPIVPSPSTATAPAFFRSRITSQVSPHPAQL